ncbi:class I SAM-dependent methyltransferase [Hydrogenophaga pseudoflava]|uniref:class I SAM-dependent methyltransferase n=1 Tax=Hydrogenophaga pseudoflava TaxID=47421 RepID=UPI0027E46104|nr:class I SAM-dependent methyltransferase [Hydrogenophaga pseudoflava]MDQ7743722.1 class I SAM-dependent methyltransferase [Hydrogenophaga pseudoflava]
MLIWPLPALLTWALAWALFAGLRMVGLAPVAAFVVALLAAGLAAWTGRTPWRRLFMLAGFPLSLLASGAAGAVPGWVWLLPLALLLALYPLGSWGDAPLFPTPGNALDGLAQRAPLPDGAAVVDAGCGLGAGLIALRRQYPRARIHGLEWSWPLALLCRLRCRFATVRRADIWAEDWSGYRMVYLFQRPESMPRAMEKAAAELAPGAWLVSLEFEATGYRPQARLETVPGKPVWIYQMPLRRG